MEFIQTIAPIISLMLTLALLIGVPVLFGFLIYKAIIGIIREVKKK